MSSVPEKGKPTDHRPFINVFVGDKEFAALLDTGATRSFISSEVAAHYLPVDVVLGMDILRTHNFSINLQTAECFLNGRSIQARPSESENRGQLHAIGPLLTSLSGEEKVRLEEFLQTELKAFEDLRGTTPLIQPY
ncbi:uncharacterized protein LOC123321569 [Coccinella septempunctata]|uniref:uncharacterized protein LOC123321569 n=1 Tax=Coccinella septempunctata TaxID=41139 RepID=UPI001D06B135|nr:uncharacterized protein LOC123321569 [Coccinella septempunctata]